MSTVYLDRPDRRFSKGVLTDPRRCIKIRVREYLISSPVVWVEVKERQGSWVEKVRFAVLKSALGTVLSGAPMESRLSDVCDSAMGIDGVRTAYRRLHRAAGGRLVPVGVVSTFRRVFFPPGGACRMTLDTEIAYYPPPEDLYERRRTLDPAGLGSPLMREPSLVLEVKFRDQTPDWCREVLDGLERCEYSKFRVLVYSVETARTAAG